MIDILHVWWELQVCVIMYFLTYRWRFMLIYQVVMVRKGLSRSADWQSTTAKLLVYAMYM